MNEDELAYLAKLKLDTAETMKAGRMNKTAFFFFQSEGVACGEVPLQKHPLKLMYTNTDGVIGKRLELLDYSVTNNLILCA